MSGFREPGFTDRQKAAQEARKNLLNKFKSVSYTHLTLPTIYSV